MDSGDLSRWRAYFRSSGSTIFDVVENAITVAALDHPSEFRVRREKIVMNIYRCDLPYDSLCSKASSSRVSSGGYKGSESSSNSDYSNLKDDGNDTNGESFSSDGDSDDGSSSSLACNFCQDVTKQFSVVRLTGTENNEGESNICVAIEDNMSSPTGPEINIDGYVEASPLCDEMVDKNTMLCDMYEEAKMVKANCLKMDTFYGAQVLSSENAEENHLIRDNKTDGCSVPEPLLFANKDLEDNETLKEVSKIKKALENCQYQSDEVIVKLLRKLLRIDLNVEILKATMIGATVNPLGKHRSREIQHHVRDLIKKWRVVVDESLRTPTPNADDKISERCLGDHSVVRDVPSNAKEPPLDLQQEPPQDNFFNGLAPVSPAVASSDLLKIFHDVDEEQFFSILPPDDGKGSDELSFVALKSIGEEQHVPEKPSLINPNGETEIGVQSQLKPDSLNTHGALQASRQLANFEGNVTIERALQANEGNLKAKLGSIEVKYQPELIKTSVPTHQRAYLGRKVTAIRALHVMERNLKAKSNIEGKNKVNTAKTTQVRQQLTEFGRRATTENLKAEGIIEATYKPEEAPQKQRTDEADKWTLEEASKVIKAGYQQDRKRRRVVQMLDLNELIKLKPKHERKQR